MTYHKCELTMAETPESSEEVWSRVAAAAGVTVDGLEFVMEAAAMAIGKAPDEPFDPDAPVKHVTAAQVCDTVKEVARDFWGKDAPRVLAEFGIVTSEDVGRCV